MHRFAAMVVALGLGAAAGAQEWQSERDNRGPRAQVCSTASDTGLCLQLRCNEARGSMRFVVTLDQGRRPDDVVPMAIIVDGTFSGQMVMERRASGVRTQWSAPYDPAQHRQILNDFRDGLTGHVIISSGSDAIIAPISLSRAGRSLRPVTQVCGPDRVAARPPQVKAPDSSVISRRTFQREFLDKRLVWGPEGSRIVAVHQDDGRYQVMIQRQRDGRYEEFNGRWRWEDGRQVCWSGDLSACFQFYRDDRHLEVRRVDGGQSQNMGRVIIVDGRGR